MDEAICRDFDFINQPKLINIDRNLWVKNRLESCDQRIRNLRQFLFRNGRGFLFGFVAIRLTGDIDQIVMNDFTMSRAYVNMPRMN